VAKLQSDLSACVALLNSHRVEYVVVGGHAVAFHPGVLGDHHVHYLGREALLRNKAASDRDKDRMDVKKLKGVEAKKRG
jgi:hypothetical protein